MYNPLSQTIDFSKSMGYGLIYQPKLSSNEPQNTLTTQYLFFQRRSLLRLPKIRRK